MIPNTETSIVEVRDLYQKAPFHENALTKLNKVLDTAKLNESLLNGYKGATILIGAEHAFNPLTKLIRFNKGKKILEQAIRRDGNNLELRYLRLTIQTNLPKFLGYSDSISIDKRLIIDGLASSKDLDLKNRVTDYLSLPNICSTDELKKLNLWKKK